jgi:hypothetical protein
MILMVLPQFSIRTAFIAVSGFAIVCLVLGLAVRGSVWAWGISIAAASLLVTAFVHAMLFFGVWLFTRTRYRRDMEKRTIP